jgi:biotin synthase
MTSIVEQSKQSDQAEKLSPVQAIEFFSSSIPASDQSKTHQTRHALETWPVAEVAALFELPFNDLLWRAQQVHRAHWDANEVELATLLSIKTGGCPENCGYCPQSAHFDTGVKAEKMMGVEEVVAAAQAAKESGATRFCMGAAWRPKTAISKRLKTW